MNDIYEKIHATGIIPVIAIDDAEKAVPLANALKEYYCWQENISDKRRGGIIR